MHACGVGAHVRTAAPAASMFCKSNQSLIVQRLPGWGVHVYTALAPCWLCVPDCTRSTSAAVLPLGLRCSPAVLAGACAASGLVQCWVN
jgi:hypothetical protein